MDLKDKHKLPVPEVWVVVVAMVTAAGTDVDLSVKATRSHQGWIQDVGSVGPSQDHHVGGRVEACSRRWSVGGGDKRLSAGGF